MIECLLLCGDSVNKKGFVLVTGDRFVIFVDCGELMTYEL